MLDPIPIDAARDAGADACFGVTITGLRRDTDGRVTGVVGRDHKGAPFTAGARITAGADGMRSTVASLTGAPVERAATSSATFIYGYWEGLAVHDYELLYRLSVTAGLFPTNGGQTCVFAGTSLGRFRSEARAGVAHTYAPLLARSPPEYSTRMPAPACPSGFGSLPGGPATSAGRSARMGARR